MKGLSYLVLGCLILSSTGLMADTMQTRVESYVPQGKIIKEEAREVKVQTPNGSVVEIEFKRDGRLDEASGDNVEKDIFVPGEGILSLKDAHAAMIKSGKAPVGEWSLEESMLHGWHYEFEGVENGKKMEYVVNAKTGKIDSKIDN